jgi:CDGSH-type Zn-finger protein
MSAHGSDVDSGAHGGESRVPFRAVSEERAEARAEIKVRDDGPYKITGPVRIVDADGGVFEVEEGRPVALCRCGHSRTKPFCDASHKSSDFRSCPRATTAAA